MRPLALQVLNCELGPLDAAFVWYLGSLRGQFSLLLGLKKPILTPSNAEDYNLFGNKYFPPL
ncbi:hypothetical protein VCHA54O485_160050 [Vibrio chagasii]|nr:hypothetical protein VCHA55P509_170050 [Vibrio chagasii]CAH6998880.1 hypothetical protein VCHA54O485_160050 [Vibrio chagasii]